MTTAAWSGQASSEQTATSPTATMNAYYDAMKKKDQAGAGKIAVEQKG